MMRAKGDWTDLFGTFRMSLDPRKLWLGFQGVVWSLVVVGLLLAVLSGLFAARGAPFALEADVWGCLRRGAVDDAVVATRHFAVAVFRDARTDWPVQLELADALGYSPVYAVLNSQAITAALITGLLVVLVLLLVWSYYGGAMMRIAAVEYALGQRIELASARAYARRKHHCFYGAPLGLVGAIVLLGLAPLVGGLVAWNVLVVALAAAGLAGSGAAAVKVRQAARSVPAGLGAGVAGLAVTIVVCALVTGWGWRVPYVGEVLLGVLAPVLFVLGLATVVIAIWCGAGGALMAGTVASSDTDVFDAWSRAFHYVFMYPWRYLWYVVVMVVYGAAIVAFLWVVRVAVEWAVLGPVALGLQGEFDVVYHFMLDRGAVHTDEVQVAPRVLAFFLSMHHFLLNLVFLSFVGSFFATAKTVVYFLMRRAVDGTPISEVHLEPRDQEILFPASAAARDA